MFYITCHQPHDEFFSSRLRQNTIITSFGTSSPILRAVRHRGVCLARKFGTALRVARRVRRHRVLLGLMHRSSCTCEESCPQASRNSSRRTNTPSGTSTRATGTAWASARWPCRTRTASHGERGSAHSYQLSKQVKKTMLISDVTELIGPSPSCFRSCQKRILCSLYYYSVLHTLSVPF